MGCAARVRAWVWSVAPVVVLPATGVAPAPLVAADAVLTRALLGADRHAPRARACVARGGRVRLGKPKTRCVVVFSFFFL
eukprot:662405-Pyramimonas_sp.AAC.1